MSRAASPDCGTNARSPEVSSTDMPARPTPFAPRFFQTLPQLRPCPSRSLRLHQAVKGTFTPELSNMLGTHKKGRPPHGKPASTESITWSRSEDVLQRQLQAARIARLIGGHDGTEGSGCRSQDRSREAGVVERVERLRPELDVPSFVDSRVLDQNPESLETAE